MRWRNSCSSGMLWSDDSTLTASGVDVVRFLDTGRVPSLFRWKNVTSVFDACSILSNLPLEKALLVHNIRDGVTSGAIASQKADPHREASGSRATRGARRLRRGDLDRPQHRWARAFQVRDSGSRRPVR